MGKRRSASRHSALLLLALSAWCVRDAAATPLLFGLVGYGDGSIDGVAFTNAQLSINAIADSGDRQPLPHSDGLTVNNVFANVSVHTRSNTLLFAAFDVQTRFFVNHDLAVAGFGHARGTGTIADGVDLFHISHVAFAAWDLRDHLSLFFDAAHGQLLQWRVAPVIVGGHVLAFDTAPSRGFFHATPEPTMVACFGAAILMTALRTVHRRRRPFHSAGARPAR